MVISIFSPAFHAGFLSTQRVAFCFDANHAIGYCISWEFYLAFKGLS